jgi:1-acyl-sn-glycerol-3-phosphate acyltransferase
MIAGVARSEHILVDQTRPFGWRGWVYTTAVNFALALGRCLLHVKVEGAQHIPRTGPVLVVANHPSYLDPPTLVALTIYYARRDLSIMAWDKLFEMPFVRFFTRTYKAYPVDRANPGRRPYLTLLHILRQGGMAGVFPEGSRSRQRLMGPWKPGALRAAFATRATLLPITFVTAGEFWPRDRMAPRLFRQHHIVIHPPLPYDEYGTDRDGRDRAYQEELANRLREIINAPLLKVAEARALREQELLRASDPLASRPDPIAERDARIAHARQELTGRTGEA